MMRAILVVGYRRFLWNRTDDEDDDFPDIGSDSCESETSDDENKEKTPLKEKTPPKSNNRARGRGRLSVRERGKLILTV